jgi:dephospho-CoA kinase
VAKIFATLGVPVYNADNAAKRLLQEDATLKKELINAFGENTYLDNQYNSHYISAIVFKDKTQLARLNAILHPAVIADGERWMNAQHEAAYTIKEAALFFESGSYKLLDFIIGVSAPYTMRIARVQKRDSLSAAQIEERMRLQLDEGVKMKLCNVVIVNDEQQSLIQQVLALHGDILQRIKNPRTV